MTRDSKTRRNVRHLRLRKKVSGTKECPRFCVSLTANNMYAQFIDDENGVTLASSSTLAPEFKALNLKRNVAAAEALGKLAAEKAVAAGISKAVFDRSGFRYHGRVKAIADAARKVGIQF